MRQERRPHQKKTEDIGRREERKHNMGIKEKTEYIEDSMSGNREKKRGEKRQDLGRREERNIKPVSS